MSDYLEAVRQACLDRCPAILFDWLPGGRVEGKSYQCSGTSGGAGDSLKVNLLKGLWKDWATDQPGGDLVSLYAAVKQTSYKDALHELARQFEITPLPPKARRKDSWQAVVPVPEAAVPQAEGSPCLPEGSFLEPVVAFWTYFDRDFNLLCFIVRLKRADGGKKFSWLTYQRNRETGICSWQKLGLSQPWPLYGLELLAQNPEKILVVEGESSAEAGRRALPDWCVITWPGGAKNVQNADWSPVCSLPDARIVLWPDNDIPGQAAMTDVAELLSRPTEIIQPDPGWPKRYDLADMERDRKPEEIRAFFDSHLRSLAVTIKASRPEVVLHGDPYNDSEAIYRAIKETESEIFYAEGPIYLRTNVYGHTEIHSFTARSFCAWAARRLDVRRYSSRGPVPATLSEALAETVLFHAQEHLPHLNFFADTPVFCNDGELLGTQGYNAKAKAYINLPRGYENHMPIEQAWELVDDLLADFPFETNSDRTAAVCYPLTAIVRHSIPGPTPIFRFEAPEPGTGKTLLCMTLSEIITPHVEFFPESENQEEIRKTLTSILTKIPAVTVFDNVEKFDSSYLQLALSEMVWGDRKLGTSDTVRVPIRTVWAATLNNPVLSPAMFRRSVRVRLNAGIENPEKRSAKWRHPEIVDYVRATRAKFVSAFVTMAGYGISHPASSDSPRLGGYEAWARRMAPILEMNGLESFLGTMEEDRRLTADPGAEALHLLVEKWAEKYGPDSLPVSELLSLAEGIEGLPIRYGDNGKPSAKGFSRMLSKARGRVISGCEIKSEEGHGGFKFFRLIGKQRTLERNAESLNFGRTEF